MFVQQATEFVNFFAGSFASGQSVHYELAGVEKLSSVHKDQVFAFGGHHEEKKPDAPQAAATDDDDKTDPSTLVLKGFFLVVALCLSLSTAFGLWMGLTQTRRKALAWLLLAAGALIPAALLIF